MKNTNQLAPALYATTINGAMRFAKLWRIVRTDGQELCFTDNTTSIDYDDGDGEKTYTPVGGFLSSAEEGEDGLSPSNRELVGIIRDDRITEEDLQAGRYRLSVIHEYTVDPTTPWRGAYRINTYTLRSTKHNADQWEGQTEGPLTKLRVTVGSSWEPTCRWKDRFGGDDCGFDLDTVRVEGAAVAAVVNAQKEFETDVPTGKGNDYYNDGKVTWLTGNNAGLISDIKDYTEEDGVLRLFTGTPYDIEVGDTFDLIPGCDGRFVTCSQYGNKDNFGGAHLMPGADDVLLTPDAPAE